MDESSPNSSTRPSIANRPDCAYFLLLGLCGAAFLLTIGGILTYVAFNPGTIDGHHHLLHPHPALSHLPHFHHHPHHQYNHNGQGHGGGQPHHYPAVHHEAPHPAHPVSASNGSVITTNHTSSSVNSTTSGHPEILHSPPPNTNWTFPNFHHDQLGPNSNFIYNSSLSLAAYEAKAKQSLILAIIGPLCILMGIIVTLLVGALALRYDCERVEEPNISFLRLRSEVSLGNYDTENLINKNTGNYELLRPSSSIEQSGGSFSINPTGLPESINS